MRILALALTLLALTAVTSNADNDVPPMPRPIPYNSPRPMPQNSIDLLGSDYHGATGNTVYTYRITAGQPEPSHAILALCTARIVAVSYAPVEIGVDPKTGMEGLKLDDLHVWIGQPLDFTVTVAGRLAESSVPWSIKAGQRIISGITTGPRCNATAVTLSGLSSEIDGIRARDIVLLLLIAAVVLLVRWALREGKGN